MRKQNNGITLIALVITIIVLLILAGVSIATLTGDNGLLTKSNEAVVENEKGEERDQVALAYQAVKLDELADSDSDDDITADNLKTALENNGIKQATVTAEADGSLTVEMPSGNKYKVTQEGIITYIGTVEENGSGNNNLPETEEVGAWTKLNKVSKTGGFDSSKGVNAPKLGSELTAVTLTTDINDYTTNGTWYNYVAQAENTDGKTSKWANAVTTDTDGSITGYYVWIPRYAYKITKGYHGIGLTPGEAGTIEVKFLKDATNELADGTGTALTNPASITYTDGVQNEWLVHPTFLSDASIGGGFGSKSGSSDGITGIWVAKFEISAFIDEADKSTRVIGEISTEQQIKLRVLPGVQSSNIKDIGTMYEFAYNMNRNADSHMVKNSEWGAIVYLAHSKYGRNGTDITANDTMYAGIGEANIDIYTGGSNTETGYLNNGIQSTTGNAYGIYDVNSGKGELIAAYVDDNTYSGLENNGGTLYTTTDMKYKNVYCKSSSREELDNYDLSYTKKGDAIYETSMIVNNDISSWFSEGIGDFPSSTQVYNDAPFFIRRLNYGIGRSWKGRGDNITFRSCLIIE